MPPHPTLGLLLPLLLVGLQLGLLSSCHEVPRPMRLGVDQPYAALGHAIAEEWQEKHPDQPPLLVIVRPGDQLVQQVRLGQRYELLLLAAPPDSLLPAIQNPKATLVHSIWLAGDSLCRAVRHSAAGNKDTCPAQAEVGYAAYQGSSSWTLAAHQIMTQADTLQAVLDPSTVVGSLPTSLLEKRTISLWDYRSRLLQAGLWPWQTPNADAVPLRPDWHPCECLVAPGPVLYAVDPHLAAYPILEKWHKKQSPTKLHRPLVQLGFLR